MPTRLPGPLGREGQARPRAADKRQVRTHANIPRPAGRRLAAWLLVAAASLAAAGARAAPAHAGAAPFPVTLTVTADTAAGAPEVSVGLQSTPGAACTLILSAAGSRHALPRRRTGSSGATGWHWRPSGLAGDLLWRFTATCRIGTLWSRRQVSYEPGFPGAGALAPADAVPAGTTGASCDGQGLCFSSDPFPVGQCTWYAQGRRPDLFGIVGGNAGSWLSAAHGRVPEGWYPVVGALAIWLPFHEGADADGHVAYVAAVSTDGRILVDDSNWRLTPTSPGLEVHEHWVSSLSPSGFIYGGPAGAGPAG
jgi:surface antigen